MRLLLVEDDPDVAPMLIEALRHRGHVVDHAVTGEDAVWLAAEQTYDAVILDVGLPDLSGVDVCARMRAKDPRVPVLMLTGRTDVAARVEGLDAGADDYLAKPVSLAELEARLRALARRADRPVVAELVAGEVSVNTASREVRRQGRVVPLVGKEYDLVELLVRRRGQVVLRTQLVQQLWDRDTDVTENALDVLVSAVRRKLDGPDARSLLTTVRGRGYRID